MRSGTTVLREFLCSTGYLNADEIFHANLNKDTRFFYYLYNKVIEDSTNLFPINFKNIFYNFINDLESRGHKNVVADVKYHEYRLLNSTYNLYDPLPFFIEYLQVTGYPIVHVVRRNKIEMLISKIIAERTGVWSSTQKKKKNIFEKVVLNTEKIVSSIEDLIRQDENIADELKKVPSVYNLEYELMFDKVGNFSDFAFSIVENISNDTGFLKIPKLKKQNELRIFERIDNFSSVKNELSNTPYYWMLNEN